MKYLNNFKSFLFAAVVGMFLLTACEGSDIYNLTSPDWLSEMGGEETEEEIISVTPNPTVLGETDNTTAWWTIFTDDVQAEAGKTYQVKFLNYGGANNWNNFVLILRNAAKDVEYAILRADNWGWTSADTDGANSDNYFAKKMESDSRDWGAWAKAMSLAKVTLTLYNYGDGSADVKITMLGSDGVTYTQDYTGLSVDKDDLYFAFTVDNCHLDFANFDVKDSDPTEMVLKGVPAKVLSGTTFEDLIANVKATVTFGEGVTKEIPAEELTLQSVPDMSSNGTKTLVAVYNKTYMGNNCEKPVIATVQFEVTDKMYKTIGALNNTGALGSETTDPIKLGAGETYITTFTNYTSGNENWHNFYVELFSGGGAEFYATLRADNYGWGTGYDAATKVFDNGGNWATWLSAMDGAKVTTFVTNNGDNTADVKAIIIGNDGKTYKQEYNGVVVKSDDLYFRHTIENSHLEFDQVVGSEDNSDGFAAAASDDYKIPAGATYITRFTNYTSGTENWYNFLVELFNQAKDKYYVTVRADNYGWGTGYAASTQVCENGGNWATWLSAMDGAQITLSVTNNGDGTADIKANILGNDGKTYIQEYNGIDTIDANDLYFHLIIEKSHLVFE